MGFRNSDHTICGVQAAVPSPIQSRLLYQVGFVLAVWVFLCLLHWHNDGLWFFDATQHAAHGFFWKDFLGNATFEPWDYVMSYFARYPIIRPTRYPPAFYFLMAAVYQVSCSPYAVKFLVLSFALMAALYTMAWCRRWVAKEAGWAGALLLLLPVVVMWSHAIMLNIPVLALSIAGLYHYRVWLLSPMDSPAWKHLYWGAFLAVLSIYTHVINCVIVLILFAWLVTERRLRLIVRAKTLLTVFISAMAVVPWYIVIIRFERGRVDSVVGSTTRLTEPSQWNWLYYFNEATSLFGIHILCLSLIGLVMGLCVARWRRVTISFVVYTLTCYLFFTYLRWVDVRYIMLLSLPIVVLCGIAVAGLFKYLGSKVSVISSGFAFGIAVLLCYGVQAGLAAKVPVPCVSGYSELVQYMEEVAPREALFYDGYRDDIFSYYVLAGDPGFQRRAVCGNRLLYAINGGRKAAEYVSSPAEVIDMLQNKGGCQWIAVDAIPKVDDVNAPGHLRAAVQGPQFELVRTFPIHRQWRMEGSDNSAVKLYRFLKPVVRLEEVEIPYVSHGKVVHARVKPIER